MFHSALPPHPSRSTDAPRSLCRLDRRERLVYRPNRCCKIGKRRMSELRSYLGTTHPGQRELRRGREIGKARTERERECASSGVEGRQSIVEERRNLGKDRCLGDDWRRISRRSDIHIDGRSEIVACIDDIQVIERLDGLGETLDRRLLGRGETNHFVHGAEKNVRVANIPIRSGEQVSAEGRTAPIERADQHLGDESWISRIEVVGLPSHYSEQRDVTVLLADSYASSHQ